jgi:hypothetical protein
MAKLTITFDVPEIDPALVDPEELADTIASAYEECRDANGGPDWPELTLETAEWT